MRRSPVNKMIKECKKAMKEVGVTVWHERRDDIQVSAMLNLLTGGAIVTIWKDGTSAPTETVIPNFLK